MSNPVEGRIRPAGPMEQLPAGQALTMINAWSEEFAIAEPLGYARNYASEVCEDVDTAPLHPSHEVVDASLDLFKQIVTRLRSPNVRFRVLNGVEFAISRPDGYRGTGQIADILDTTSEGYAGIGPAARPGEPSSVGAAREYSSHLRNKAFIFGRDWRIVEERRIREAGEKLGDTDSPKERIFNLVEHMVDGEDLNECSRFFLATLQTALDRNERREILGAAVALDSMNEDDDLGRLWMSHHLRYPTDLPGGVPAARELLGTENPRESVISYLNGLRPGVQSIVKAVRDYQAKLAETGQETRAKFLAELE